MHMSSPSDALNAFFNIVQEHITSSTAEGRQAAAWRGPNADQYAAELRILKPHYQPILWGCCCSVISFVAFRVSGAGVRISRPSAGSGGGYRLTRLNDTGTGGGSHQTAATSTNRMATAGSSSNDAEAKSQLLGRILTIPVDLALSILIGCSAALFLTEPDKLRKDLASVPLVEGRSFVADELCHDFTLQYHKWPDSSLWTSSKIVAEHPSVGAIHDFVRNCTSREEYERKLRQERGLGKESPVSIPSPGVFIQSPEEKSMTNHER